MCQKLRGSPDGDRQMVRILSAALTDGLAAVEAACAELLADFKRPRAVYRVGQLPRSTLAKLNKVELRAVAEPRADRAGAEKRWADAARLDPSGNAG